MMTARRNQRLIDMLPPVRGRLTAGSSLYLTDTPRPDEDIYTAADHWLSTLAAAEQRAQTISALVEAIRQKQAAAAPS